jgi:hypothetical protein
MVDGSAEMYLVSFIIFRSLFQKPSYTARLIYWVPCVHLRLIDHEELRSGWGLQSK